MAKDEHDIFKFVKGSYMMNARSHANAFIRISKPKPIIIAVATVKGKSGLIKASSASAVRAKVDDEKLLAVPMVDVFVGLGVPPHTAAMAALFLTQIIFTSGRSMSSASSPILPLVSLHVSAEIRHIVTYLCIEHFTLCAQAVTLRHKLC